MIVLTLTVNGHATRRALFGSIVDCEAHRFPRVRMYTWSDGQAPYASWEAK